MDRETLTEFIARNQITIQTQRSNFGRTDGMASAWDREARHWLVVLSMPARFTPPVNPTKLETPTFGPIWFSQGSAHTKLPTAGDVLSCLASDAASVENARSFEDWADEFGYDADSRSAKRIYRECKQQAKGLRAWLGREEYSRLLWETDHDE